MRFRLFTLAALSLWAITCSSPPTPPPRACVPFFQSGLQGEPFLEGRPVTFDPGELTSPCRFSGLQAGGRVEVFDPLNRPVETQMSVDGGVSFVAGIPGWYFVSLTFDDAIVQREILVARDRTTARVAEDLPVYCLDVQRTSEGTWLCYGPQKTYAIRNGQLTPLPRAVLGIGNVVWATGGDEVIRLLDTGLCLASEGRCADAGDGSTDGGAWDIGLAGNRDELAVIRLHEIVLWRHDGGTAYPVSRRSHRIEGTLAGWQRHGSIHTGTSLFVAAPGDAGTTRLCQHRIGPTGFLGDTPTCTTLRGWLSGRSETGFWLSPEGSPMASNARALVFQPILDEALGRPVSTPMLPSGSVSLAGFPMLPRPSAPVGSPQSNPRTFDYVSWVGDAGIVFEIYSLEATIRGADERHVWARIGNPVTRTRLFER